MGTGVTPKRIATKNSLLSYLTYCPLMRYTSSVLTTSQLRCSLELSPHMSGPPLRKTLSSKLARFPCIVPTHSLLNSQTVKQPLLYFLRKEVIQPHLPIRLPCYDFTPVISPAFGSSLLKGWVTDFGRYQLPWCDGRCVQDPGTYSPQHSDLRLLAIPASCSRVADYNPN